MGSQSEQAAIPRLALSPKEAAATLSVSRNFFDEHIGHELRWVRRSRRKLVALVKRAPRRKRGVSSVCRGKRLADRVKHL